MQRLVFKLSGKIKKKETHTKISPIILLNYKDIGKKLHKFCTKSNRVSSLLLNVREL